MRLYRPEIASHVLRWKLAPEVGFEPTTNRLTADRSTTELLWIRFVAEWEGHTLCSENRQQQVVSKIQFQRGNLVAGAGFEPAIPPQRRDYESDERCTPVR